MRAPVIMLLAALASCRNEATPGAAPPAATPHPSAAASESEPALEPATEPEPEPEPPPSGPALPASGVLAHFRGAFTPWAATALSGHPLRDNLTALVASDVVPQRVACAEAGARVASLVSVGSPDLLEGDPALASARAGSCWALHFDGMMGPGLGALLAEDGAWLLVWVILEG